MTPMVLTLSKVLLLVVIYAFLWVVARAVRGQLTPPAAARDGLATLDLIFTAPAGIAGSVTAVAGPVVIGRGADSDLVIDDPFASDRHARFDRIGGRLIVEDLGSRNGTLVNGVAIQGRRALEHGDTIRLGETIMEVR